jgi:Na+/H+-dicarboxylate symporter
MRETFTLGVATNSSANCMPAMVDGLVERLHFARARVELLVPLSVSLLRIGAVAYFVCGTLFVAELYDRNLTAMEVGLVVLVSALSGFASAGMAGILTISLIGTACTYLGLPFEAAFILFVAVDPICAMARTAVTVISCCAAVSIVCDKPSRTAEVVLQPLEDPRA